MPELLVESLLGYQHVQDCSPKTKADKMLAQKVTKAMDAAVGKKGIAIQKHREYGHNREFVLKKFKTKKERSFASIHLLGDFHRDIWQEIVGILRSRFDFHKLESPYYEQIQKNKWDWDITKAAKRRLIQRCSQAFVSALKDKSRLTLESNS